MVDDLAGWQAQCGKPILVADMEEPLCYRDKISMEIFFGGSGEESGRLRRGCEGSGDAKLVH